MIRLPSFFIVLLLSALFPGLGSARFELGIDVLAARQFDLLQGKRVGLLTHPAGVNGAGISSIDVLRQAPEVNLVALFGPEHGLYGNEKADVPIENRIDARTRLPIFSLYGKNRYPTEAMLDLIDVLVVDLQDIGVRSYTYVSCMRYAMEACFRANKTIVVLDRPNPLGGQKVDGPLLDPEWKSYVGAFPVPYVHGLTIGELATMAKKEPGVLEVSDRVRENGHLEVVPMKGWRRDMLWTDTGLKWIPTSPAIPDLSAVLGYPMTGLGTQLGSFTHGYGTLFPFRCLQFRGHSPEQIARELTQRQIPGLAFRIINLTEQGQARRGVYVVVTDWKALRPTELSFQMMQLTCEWSHSNPYANASEAHQRLFNIHVGSTAWWKALSTEGASVNVAAFVERWSIEAKKWQTKSQQWWLYPATK